MVYLYHVVQDYPEILLLLRLQGLAGISRWRNRKIPRKIYLPHIFHFVSYCRWKAQKINRNTRSIRYVLKFNDIDIRITLFKKKKSSCIKQILVQSIKWTYKINVARKVILDNMKDIDDFISICSSVFFVNFKLNSTHWFSTLVVKLDYVFGFC